MSAAAAAPAADSDVLGALAVPPAGARPRQRDSEARHSPSYTPDERRHAARAVAAALALGVAGDLLLRAGEPGLNVPVATAFGLAGLAWLARGRGRTATVGAAAVGALAMAFAAAIALRDSPALLALNVLALAAAACALGALVRDGPALALDQSGPAAYARGAVRTLGQVAAGAPALARPALAAPWTRQGQVRLALGVGVRGAALALPALVIFGALLAAADGAFAALAERLVDWDVGATAGHVVVAGAFAWAAAGYLHSALRATPPDTGAAPSNVPSAAPAATPAAERNPLARAAEWCVALALVDLLFVAFGAVQLGWLFGGRALVASTAVSYAEYARRGFFELIVVAALALPAALGAYGAGARALGAEDLAGAADAGGAPAPRARRVLRRALRVAAAALVACVGVVLVSAADRMRLYQAAYGLTELRFYASAFMAWLAVVGACAAATILRDRPAPFALGALASGWLWVLALDAADPDARIAGANSARAAAGLPFDAAYATWLSADAAPALLARMAMATTDAQPAHRTAACAVVERVDALRRADADWRTWNLSRRRAAALAEGAERAGQLRPWRAACAASRHREWSARPAPGGTTAAPAGR